MSGVLSAMAAMIEARRAMVKRTADDSGRSERALALIGAIPRYEATPVMRAARD